MYAWRRVILDNYLVKSVCAVSYLECGGSGEDATRRWRRAGVWKRVHDALREKGRKAADKKPTPTAAIIDSLASPGGRYAQTGAGGDGAWRGLARPGRGVLRVADAQGAVQAAEGGVRRLGLRPRGLPEWVAETFSWLLQTVLRPAGADGFVVLPKRWIVERTFAWLMRYRRHCRDYERNPQNCETMIDLAMTNLMSRRLAKI